MSLKRFFNRLRLGNAIDQPGLEGETLLTRAIKSGNAETVREFLDLGADPDVKNKAGELPLHIALVMRNLKVLHLLLETGADIFKKQNGLTLREHAEKLELKGVAQSLLALEARKQEALIAASIMPMGMMGGVAVLPPFLPRDAAQADDAKPATGTGSAKPSRKTDSRGPG
jgi:hypothetical protein